MSRRKDYEDLKLAGGMVLRTIAGRIVESDYIFKQSLADELGCATYSVSRYMYALTQRLLLDDFGKLECAIKNILDKCSNGEVEDVVPERVKHNRERYEKELMSSLHKLHEEAIQRYIG